MRVQSRIALNFRVNAVGAYKEDDMRYPFQVLDVFTDRRYAGNPLAVVLDADALTVEDMQRIAREFNLSETIFVQRPDDAAHTAKVRIFLPVAEIPFAGHPTVGCSVLLAEKMFGAEEDFETKLVLEGQAGLVPVTVTRKAGAVSAMFTAPVIPEKISCTLPQPELVARALGLTAARIGLPGHGVGAYRGGPEFLFVPVQTAADLAEIRIDSSALQELQSLTGLGSFYVYAKGDGAQRIRGRMFAPGAGIPEDPATGSATACLAGQLLASGALQSGGNQFDVEQGYEMGRPSQLLLEADVAGGKLTAVRVAGSAVYVSEGTIEAGRD